MAHPAQKQSVVPPKDFKWADRPTLISWWRLLRQAPISRELLQHPFTIDLFFTTTLWIILVPAVGGSFSGGVLETITIVPLALRRVHPVASFTAVSLGLAVNALLFLADVGASSGMLIFPLALYSLAKHSKQRKVRLTGLGVAALGSVFVVFNTQEFGGPSVLTFVTVTPIFFMFCTTFWFAGQVGRQRIEAVQLLAAQNGALRREQKQREAMAAQSERVSIAREMHDVVAHSLAVIVVQADGALFVADNSPTWTPNQSRQALENIAATAREALAETRSLVQVLRNDADSNGHESMAFRPTVGLSHLSELIERLHDAGVEVHSTQIGPLATLERNIDLAAYRIIQEALTNVLKHSGPQSVVNVNIVMSDDITISVIDDGAGKVASPTNSTGGSGIIGMNERAKAVGGTVTAKPTEHQGFEVRATLPLTPTHVASEPESTHD